MKKSKQILAILFVLVAFVSMAFSLDAKVIDARGKVEVQQGDSWVALKAGDTLDPGAVVSTGFKSEAVLQIGKSVVNVKALTRLTVEQLYEKNGDHSSSVYLDAGAIAADVKPAENKRVGFTVKTPAATASVRGTSGLVGVGFVKGTSGRWFVGAPTEKSINYDRGDALQEESDAVASSNDLSSGSQKTEESKVESETKDKENASQTNEETQATKDEAADASEKTTPETPAPVTPAGNIVNPGEIIKQTPEGKVVTPKQTQSDATQPQGTKSASEEDKTEAPSAVPTAKGDVKQTGSIVVTIKIPGVD